MNRPARLALAALFVLAACRAEVQEPGAAAAEGSPPDAPVPPVAEGETPLVAEGPASGGASGPATPGAPPELPEFRHDPPGALPSGSGSGASDLTIWAPNMRFPMAEAPAFANSQVYGVGGFKGPPGGQCDSRNYGYPWRDNFCETRGYSNMFCGNGRGHQGQDIRPATCEKGKHRVVAAETGTITAIGSYTVFLTAKSGRLYRYLHMDMNNVRQNLRVGQEVVRGAPIGFVSNDFGATPTTIHLHLEIKSPVSRDGKTVFTFVPPYPSLVLAYRRLLSVSSHQPD